MSVRLLAVRHGQASLHSADYDQLSELGALQCKYLGAWLRRHEGEFDAVLCGSLRRHQQSLVALRAGYEHPMPDAQIDPDLDEYHFQAILQAFLSAPEHAHLRPQSGDGKALLRVLPQAVRAWADAKLPMPEPLRYVDFAARVARAAERIATLQGRVLVLSSGGVLSVLTGQVLGLPPLVSLEFNLSYENSALSEYRHAEGRWRMLRFNALPHLPEPALRTLA